MQGRNVFIKMKLTVKKKGKAPTFPSEGGKTFIVFKSYLHLLGI